MSPIVPSFHHSTNPSFQIPAAGAVRIHDRSGRIGLARAIPEVGNSPSVRMLSAVGRDAGTASPQITRVLGMNDTAVLPEGVPVVDGAKQPFAARPAVFVTVLMLVLATNAGI